MNNVPCILSALLRSGASVRRVIVIAVTFVVALGTAIPGAAYSGALDPIFSGDGVVNLGRADRARVVARADGVLLTATQRSTRDGVATTVRATLPNGTPDLTFSGDGVATPRLGAGRLADVAVDSADRLYLLAGAGRTVLTRLTWDGRIDRDYGGEGRRLIEDRKSYPTALTIDSRGRAVVLLTTVLAPRKNTSDALVVRVLPGGRLDDTFGRSGVRRVDIGNNDYSEAIDTDIEDRPVVAGASFGSSRVPVFRLTEGSGRLDRSFSGDGVARVGFVRAGDGISTVVEASGPGVTVGGFLFAHDDSFPAFAARFTQVGALDADFGGDGRVLLDVGSRQGLTATAVDASGAVLAAGSDSTGRTTSDALVGGLHADGSVDTGFGPAGRSVLAVGQGRVETGPGLVVDGQFVVLVRSEVQGAKRSRTSYQLVRLVTPT